MALDFGAGAGAGSPMDLIPNGQMAWVIIGFREMKVSKAGGKYVDLELTLDDGQPFSRRKVWTNVMDPMDGSNSEAARQMGMAAITRILEAARWGTKNGPFQEEAFKAHGGYVINDYSDLHGLRAAVKIKISPAKDGYAEKNEVAEFLSPNPKSAGFKGWEQLCRGVHNATATTGQAAQGAFSFGGGQAATPVQAGFPAAATPTQPAAPAFGQPQQGAPAGPAQGAAPFGGAQTNPPVHASPSVPAASASSPSSTQPQQPVQQPAAAQPAFAGGASWLQQAQQPAQ